MTMVGGLNAKRFAGKPLKQPTYSFKDIPRCAKDLQGSSLQLVDSREQMNDAMAEMILLCNETMRRLHIEQKVGKRTAKPLSLEYIADRLDVDDPMFGFLIRTETEPEASTNQKWKRGMLQGFITVTTFTNWQKTFRWDSMHDSAFAYDDEALAEAMASGVRRYDQDGVLAEALQRTVRCGDPWNEGIVWPRIAEISLLGALGCGKNLVSLVIEKLECMKPEAKRNYDYVTLQATENSIPFYESIGFVRVGGITEDDKFEEKQAKARGKDSSGARDSDDSSPNGGAMQSEIVSSAVDLYVTKVAGETPADVAKKLKVNVWDIVFLNHYVYPDIGTRSRLMKDTQLYVPSAKHVQAAATSNATRIQSLETEPSAPQWYIADENDTPRMIAKKFDVNCAELVEGNRERLPELNWNSRLKEGTRVKVSHFHIHDDKHVPYCHWTFPDDSFETSEPSYMMVRKLNRKTGAMAKVKPVESSLAVPVSEYSAPPSDLFNQVQESRAPAEVAKGGASASQKLPSHPSEPNKPKRPLSGYMLYCCDQREARKDEFVGMRASDVMKILSKLWRELPESERAPYVARHAKDQSRYKTAMEKYAKDLEAFYESNPGLKVSASDGNDTKSQTLFNKVVRLNAEGIAQTGSEHEFYFVLTFIPDLCWAHLAPLRRVGTWGADKPKAEGRPIWMLVDESEGQEVDISGAFCVPVRSRAMRRTADADCEQWDILDSDEESSSASATKPLSNAVGSQVDPQQSTGKRKRGRPRKHPLPDCALETAKQQRTATKPLSGYVAPKKKRGRPRKHPLPEPAIESSANGKWGCPAAQNQISSTKLLTRSDEPNERGRPHQSALPAPEPGAAKSVTKRRGRPPKQPTPSPASSSPSNGAEWDPEVDNSAPKRRGRPPKLSRSATKPLDGKIERKKRKRGPSVSSVSAGGGIKTESPKRRGRPRKALPHASVEEQEASNLLPDEEEARPTKRRKLPSRVAKPVPGSLQDSGSAKKETPTRRERPRGQTPQVPVDEQQASNLHLSDDEEARSTRRRLLPNRSSRPVLGSLQDGGGTKKGSPDTPGRPRKQAPKVAADEQQASHLLSDHEVVRPAKRRKLPSRGAKPVLGSLQDADSDEDGGMTPLTCSYKRRTSTPSRRARTLDGGHEGTSPFRTVALTRSAQKLSRESSLMFRPTRVRARG